MPVQRPSALALVLGLIPFVAMCLSVALRDHVEPTIFGVPFNLAWLIAWTPLTTLFLWAAYRVEAAREKGQRDANERRHA